MHAAKSLKETRLIRAHDKWTNLLSPQDLGHYHMASVAPEGVNTTSS